MAGSRLPRWLAIASSCAAVLVLAAVLFRWDWLIPLIERQASAAVGREVAIRHLDVEPAASLVSLSRE